MRPFFAATVKKGGIQTGDIAVIFPLLKVITPAMRVRILIAGVIVCYRLKVIRLLCD